VLFTIFKQKNKIIKKNLSVIYCSEWKKDQINMIWTFKNLNIQNYAILNYIKDISQVQLFQRNKLHISKTLIITCLTFHIYI